jgi:hypothetical protein
MMEVQGSIVLHIDMTFPHTVYILLFVLSSRIAEIICAQDKQNIVEK